MTEAIENGDADTRPNLVVLIFSKVPRIRTDWAAVASKTFASIDGWKEYSSRLLDASNTGIDDAKGGVYEIQARIGASTGTGDLTMAGCRALRDGPKIQKFEKDADVQVICQPCELYQDHKTPGLAVFDMDSTLIQQEVIDELARAVGKYEQVAAITEAAMRGELDFEESLRARVAQLKGVTSGIWDQLKKTTITFTPGARELVQALRSLGWKTAVLSGGFTPLAFWVRDTLGLDYAYANELGIDTSSSTLSGELLAGTPIVGAKMKEEHLERLAAENGIPRSRTIAVGDGSNDLLMMNAAGLGIAFNAKPKVQQAAPARLNGPTLLDVLYILGFTKSDIEKALRP